MMNIKNAYCHLLDQHSSMGQESRESVGWVIKNLLGHLWLIWGHQKTWLLQLPTTKMCYHKNALPTLDSKKKEKIEKNCYFSAVQKWHNGTYFIKLEIKKSPNSSYCKREFQKTSWSSWERKQDWCRAAEDKTWPSSWIVSSPDSPITWLADLVKI